MGTYNKTLFLPVVHHTNLKTTPESLEDTLTANNLQLPTHLSTTMSFTANSRAPQIHPSNAPQEPTGQVASDSLAAESLKNQGGFAENAHAAASSVSGSSSTLNNDKPAVVDERPSVSRVGASACWTVSGPKLQDLMHVS